jgi:hypothetical protein
MMMTKMGEFYNLSIHKDKLKINIGVLKGLLFYDCNFNFLHIVWIISIPYFSHKSRKEFQMITSETPYKLADIIRDTWPQLYRKPKTSYSKKNIDKFKDEKV